MSDLLALMKFPKLNDLAHGINEIQTLKFHLMEFVLYPFIGLIWTIVCEVLKGYGVGDKKFKDPMTELAVKIHVAMFILCFGLIYWLDRCRNAQSNIMDQVPKIHNTIALIVSCAAMSVALPFLGVYALQTEAWTWQSLICYWLATTFIIALLRFILFLAKEFLKYRIPFKDENDYSDDE